MDAETLNRLEPDALRKLMSGPADKVAELTRVAAEGGSAEAQLILGQMLLDGRGVAPSSVDALRWFSTAAAAGHVMAMNMVGRCYDNGWGVAVDKARAAEWYRAAADRGLDWGMYNLATLLALGDGVPEDRAAALVFFRRAAALGHAKSINMVGSFYEDGWVVDRDADAAADYYRRAAEAGDFRGQFNHARMLIERGRLAEAIEWIRRVPSTGTPAFVAKVRDWLFRRPEIALQQVALDLDARSGYENASQ
jgi:TPR repeat protein